MLVPEHWMVGKLHDSSSPHSSYLTTGIEAGVGPGAEA
jgi:hypothetical protein